MNKIIIIVFLFLVTLTPSVGLATGEGYQEGYVWKWTGGGSDPGYACEYPNYPLYFSSPEAAGEYIGEMYDTCRNLCEINSYSHVEVAFTDGAGVPTEYYLYISSTKLSGTYPNCGSPYHQEDWYIMATREADTGQPISDLEPTPTEEVQTVSGDPRDQGDCDGENCVCDLVGDPVKAGTGNSFQTETDYVGAGPFPLEFRRYYNSLSDYTTSPIGAKWRHTYDRHVIDTGSGTADVVREDGKTYAFTLQGSDWVAAPDVTGRLEQSAGGWLYTSPDDTVETYDANGYLTEITNRAGLTITLAYSGTELTTVTGPFGRTLGFTYLNGRIDTLTDPGGQVYQYSYTVDANDPASYNLTQVTYPDSSVRSYAYEGSFLDTAQNILYHYPSVLSEITRENGNRTHWTYDGQGRVIANELGWDGTGQVAIHQLAYDDTVGTTTVSDPNGNDRTFHFETQHGATKVGQIDGSPCASCGGDIQQVTYDANGFLQSTTDHNGTVTDYVYNARGLPETVTEAVGTAEELTTHTIWHNDYRLPVCREEPLRTLLMDYNGEGQLTRRIEIDTTDPAQFPDAASKSCASVQANRASSLGSWHTRIRDYAYYTSGALTGLLQSIDGPLPPDAAGQDDVTTFVYDTATGNMTAIQRPYGNTVSITAHDAHGRPTTVVDPNGLTTNIVYTPRGRVDRIEVGSTGTGFEVTDYTYDAAGNLISVILPDGSGLYYVYDAADRLTDVYDQPNQQGNHIRYTLDGLGNTVETTRFDPQGTLKRKQSFVYDVKNRLQAIENAAGATVQSFTYDASGNLLTSDDSANTTSYTYDALDRLVSTTDALQGVAQYGYDAQDNLVSVQDPRGNTTNYQYDGLGNLTQQTSPDTGVTGFTGYDAAGNLLSRTDARGVTTSYTYDALSRLTTIDYPTQTDTTYTYDSCPNGTGRLCSVTDASGSTSWSYDLHGRVTARTQTVDGVSLTVQYGYDSAGRLSTLTYPSGNTVTLSYTDGRVTALASNGGTIMQAMVYDPFGPLTTWNWGNGEAMQRLFDQDGRLDRYTRGDALYDINYNLTGTVSEILDPGNPANDQSFGYDALLRLTHVDSAAPVYTYDANGNRTSTVVGGQTVSYGVDPLSNRLTSVDGTTYSHDPAGNLLDNGTHTFVYNDNNRLSTLDAGTANEVAYRYNALGQRVAKQGSQTILTGDVNGDGVIDRRDLHRVVDTLLERKAEAANEDCDTDTQVTNKDLVCIANVEGATSAASAQILFLYDEDGRLIGEYDAEGNVIQETVWLGSMPVAVIEHDKHYYIHTDHLDTPRAVTNETGTVIWRWDGEAFGATPPNEDPDGDGAAFALNLRFPGQYYDPESGLYYNHFRYYDSDVGRYVTSDPIGLGSGLNTYAYVGGNPLYWADPNGLLFGFDVGESTADSSALYWARKKINACDPLAKLGYAVMQGLATLWAPGISEVTLGTFTGGAVISKIASRTGALSQSGKGLGNPFKGKTPEQIGRMFKSKGYETRGSDPVSGKGGYVNPRTGRSYHIDSKPRNYRRGRENPHVDVNRPRSYSGDLLKRKYPLGDRLYE